MAKAGKRQFVVLKSSESGHQYFTSKNKNKTPGKLEMKKYDPHVRRHVLYVEDK